MVFTGWNYLPLNNCFLFVYCLGFQLSQIFLEFIIKIDLTIKNTTYIIIILICLYF